MAVFCFDHKEITELSLCVFVRSGQNLKNRICGIDLGSKFLMHINICRGGNRTVSQPGLNIFQADTVGKKQTGTAIYAINGIAFTYATDIGGRVFSGTCSGVLNFSAYLGAAEQSVVYGFILNNGGWGIVFVSIAVFNVLIAVLGIIGAEKHQKSW